MMLVATGYKPRWAHRLLADLPSYSLAVRSCKEAQLYLRWMERRDPKAPPVETPIDSKWDNQTNDVRDIGAMIAVGNAMRGACSARERSSSGDVRY